MIWKISQNFSGLYYTLFRLNLGNHYEQEFALFEQFFLSCERFPQQENWRILFIKVYAFYRMEIRNGFLLKNHWATVIASPRFVDNSRWHL